jgi:type II secretory pathway pseudopilin PulG
LIEMLVVIAVIGILAAVIGVSLGTGNSAIALQNSQGTLLSALSGARAKAALNQTNAGIFVNATPTSDGFLREIQIAIEFDHDNSPATAPRWIAKGDAIQLSSGIYLVPSAAAFPATIVDFQPNTAAWTDAQSTAYNDTEIVLYGSDGTTRIDSADYNRLVVITERGTTSGAGKLTLSPARVAAGATGLIFDQVQALRGARVSIYGVATLVEGLESFK